jgi:hypothetical protein
MDATVPWIGNPAQDAMKAFQIGAQVGAQRRENQFRQQQQGIEKERLLTDKTRSDVENSVAQQTMQLKIQDAQRMLKAQQGYRSFVDGGGDPIEGMMKYGPEMGESMTGLGTLAEAKRREAAVPREVQTTEDGTSIWQLGERLYGFNKPTKASLPGALTDEQKTAVGALQKQLSALDTFLEKHPDPTDPIYGKQIKESMNRRQVLQDQLHKLLPSMDPDGTDSSDQGDDPLGLFTK